MKLLVRNATVSTAFVIAALALGGCSSGSMLHDVFSLEDSGKSSAAGPVPKGGAMAPDMATADEQAVAELYNGGLRALQAGQYTSAQKKFAEVERQHPYSKWATKAILMQGFAAYQKNSYDDAINACNRFITIHPGHKDTPYAYYLIALSQYERISSVSREQSQTRKAVDALEEVARRFPDSPYAADATQKAKLGYDRLAAKELDVGRFYAKKGDYLAAINRYKKVVTDYQTTAQTPEALYRLSEAYMALGVLNEAQTAAAVLGHNYPNSSWYQSAYTLVSTDGKAPVEDQASWISRAFHGVTG
jgi:outer membrane protein assembly factor BamD